MTRGWVVVTGLVGIALAAAPAQAQRYERSAVTAASIDSARGFNGPLFARRVGWSALAGPVALLPFAAVTFDETTRHDGSPAVMAWASYTFVVAAVAASKTSATNRCYGEKRLFRALLGAGVGQAAFWAIVSGLDAAFREGPSLALGATMMFVATPVGAAVALLPCD